MTTGIRRRAPLALALLALLVAAGWLVVQRLGARQALTAQTSASARAVAASPVVLEAADLAEARTLPLSSVLAVGGGLKAANTAFVKAKVAGELLRLSVREGEPVRAGQAIGEIDPAELDLRLKQAERNADAARAQLDIAQRNLGNSRSLVTQGFISDTALQGAVANEAAARATHEAALAAVDLARKARADARLVAPIDGWVAQRLAQPGERLAVDARVVEVVDLDRLELEAPLAPELAAQIRVGQPAQLSVEGVAAPLQGRVARINPSAQAGTRAVMVYVALTAPSGLTLRQGLYARGEIELSRSPALVIPVSAVRLDAGSPRVQLLRDTRAVTRAVRLGRRGQARWEGDEEPAVEVTEGLQPGDRVLRLRAGVLADGAEVRLPPAGMPPPR